MAALKNVTYGCMVERAEMLLSKVNQKKKKDVTVEPSFLLTSATKSHQCPYPLLKNVVAYFMPLSFV